MSWDWTDELCECNHRDDQHYPDGDRACSVTDLHGVCDCQAYERVES